MWTQPYRSAIGSGDSSGSAAAVTAIMERDGDWHVAYCPEVPGANGQGRSKEEARASLAAAVELVLQDLREDLARTERLQPG